MNPRRNVERKRKINKKILRDGNRKISEISGGQEKSFKSVSDMVNHFSRIKG